MNVKEYKKEETNSGVMFTYKPSENITKAILFQLPEHRNQFEDLLIEAGYKEI